MSAAASPVILSSLQVGLPQQFGTADAPHPHDRLWTTGIHKQPVTGPIDLGPTGLVGDGVADLVHHGGSDKAINAYPADHYPTWQAELGRPDFGPGAFGENFTIAGLVEGDLAIGDRFRVGDSVVIEVSQPREPCWKLARRWRMKDLAVRVIATGRSGWYFRVITPGVVAAGMPLTRIARGSSEWTITAANAVMHGRPVDRAAAGRLATVPGLATSWVEALTKMAQG
jgi:MOSC domain-containing protein YiiM